MSFKSQLAITIVQYISLFGLTASVLITIFTANRKKKLLFMFISFLFVGILIFISYSGVVFFIIGAIILFFFLSLYLLVFQIRLSGNKGKREQDKKPVDAKRNKIFYIIPPLLACAATGYLIYIYTSGFLGNISISREITIAGLGDIAGQLITDHSFVLILIVALFIMSFLWFLIIGLRRK